MARLKNVKKNHFVSTLPTAINKQLVDGYRVKLSLKPINNFWFTPFIRA